MHIVPPSGRSGFQGRFTSEHCIHAGAAKSARELKKKKKQSWEKRHKLPDVNQYKKKKPKNNKLHGFNMPWEGPIVLIEAKLMLI